MTDDNTRDIVIDTRADVRNLSRTLSEYIEESRQHRQSQDQRHETFRDSVEKKFEEYDAIFNRGRGIFWFAGVIWGFIVLGVGWLIEHASSWLWGPTIRH